MLWVGYGSLCLSCCTFWVDPPPVPMPLSREERKQIGVLIVVIAGSVVGFSLLMFLIATDV